MARVAVSQCPPQELINERSKGKRATLQRRARRTFTLSPSRFPRISTRPSVPPHVSRRVPAFLTRARQRHRVLIEFGLPPVAWGPLKTPVFSFSLGNIPRQSPLGFGYYPLLGFQFDVIYTPHQPPMCCVRCVHWYLTTTAR